jgi:hypothetical protein
MNDYVDIRCPVCGVVWTLDYNCKSFHCADCGTCIYIEDGLVAWYGESDDCNEGEE